MQAESSSARLHSNADALRTLRSVCAAIRETGELTIEHTKLLHFFCADVLVTATDILDHKSIKNIQKCPKSVENQQMHFCT